MIMSMCKLYIGLGLASRVFAFLQIPAGTTWDYPLGDKSFSAASADPGIQVYGVDLVNTATSDIATLQKNGHTVICYFSGGSVESYRPDAGDFPPSAVGKVMAGWPDEKWVDTRDSRVRALMGRRLALAQSKGCDGVDVDNIDGHANDTGFELTEDDAVAFVRAMADGAHDRGLAYGLKNGGDLLGRVLGDVQWAINEQCVLRDECGAYAPLLDAGKPVFHVEYTDDEGATGVDAEAFEKDCAAGGLQHASTIVKHLSLDKWIKSCETSIFTNQTTSNTTSVGGSTSVSSPTTTPSSTTSQAVINQGARPEFAGIPALVMLLVAFTLL